MSPHAEAFRRLVRERSGLVLTPDKDYLLKSRLEPLAREAGLPGAPELLAAAVREPGGALAARAVDALATHESSFFRDGTPFEQLRASMLPALVAARRPGARLRVWSAACSSGQEPYSLAMLFAEQAHVLAGRAVDILATDMSEPILAKARTGLYSDFEVSRGLSPERRDRWMVREDASWRVAPDLARTVRFARHNLLEGPPPAGLFDLIFCRNVLIYFDAEGKRAALTRLHAAMEPDAALVVGGAETLVGFEGLFRPVNGLRGVMRRAGAEQRLAG